MLHLGDYPLNGIVDFKWNSQGANGASITRATNGTIRIYKNNSATERASAAGITDTEDFDALTGVHHLRIDLSDDTDSGFYAAGSEYQVVLQGAVIDGQTVNAVLAHFSIERSGGVLALIKSRLPTSLVGGRIDASVGAMAADVLTASALAADALAEINAEVDTALADYDGPTHAELVSEINDVQADTEDIQARLPAALVGGRIDANASALDGDASAAQKLSKSARTIVEATADTGASSTVIPLKTSSPTPTAVNQFQGRIVIFRSDTATTALRGAGGRIASSTTTSVTLETADALPATPAEDDAFVIL